MVQILPGVDEYLSRGIKDIGDTLSLFFETDRKTQRGIRNMLLEKPELVQEFVDLEKRAPGTLRKLGFGNIADSLDKLPESAKSAVERTTSGEVVRGAQATAKVRRQAAETTSEGYELLPDIFKKNPKLREDFARGIVDLPSVLEQAKAERETEVATAAQVGRVKNALASGGELNSEDIEAVAQSIVNGEGTFGDMALRAAAQNPVLKMRVEALQAEKEAELDAANKPASNRITDQNSLLGHALGVGEKLAETVTFPNADEIFAELVKAAPNATGEEIGLMRKAAFDASQQIRTAQGARTVDQNRLRLLYSSTLAPSLERLQELEDKGVRWNTRMDAAIAELKGTTWSNIGGVFGKYGGAGGTLSSTDLPTSLLRRGVRESLSQDELDYLNNAVMFIEGSLRPQTGLRIEPKEFSNYVNMFLNRVEETDNTAIQRKQEVRQIRTDATREAAGLRPDYYPKLRERLNLGQPAPPQPPDVMARDTVNQLLDANGNDPKSAMKQFMEGVQSGLTSGKIAGPALTIAQNMLNSILELDGRAKVLEDVKTKSVALNDTITQLRSQINQLRGKETKAPPLKSKRPELLPQEYVKALTQELVRLNNELPNAATQDKRDTIEMQIAGVQNELDRFLTQNMRQQ